MTTELNAYRKYTLPPRLPEAGDLAKRLCPFSDTEGRAKYARYLRPILEDMREERQRVVDAYDRELRETNDRVARALLELMWPEYEPPPPPAQPLLQAEVECDGFCSLDRRLYRHDAILEEGVDLMRGKYSGFSAYVEVKGHFVATLQVDQAWVHRDGDDDPFDGSEITPDHVSFEMERRTEDPRCAREPDWPRIFEQWWTAALLLQGPRCKWGDSRTPLRAVTLMSGRSCSNDALRRALAAHKAKAQAQAPGPESH